MMKKIFSILTVLGLCLSMNAEVRTIKGTVKDAKGEPVLGAVIMVEGVPNAGAVTDADGKYVLKADFGKNAVLVCNCIGFKDGRAAIGSGAVYDILLEEDAELLDEVVVVGYGAMRRSDLTGSVSSVKIDEDAAARSTTLDQMLEGRAAGMQVLSTSGSPDAGINIRVRGLASFGDSEPLYVVDGIIVNGESEELTTIDGAVSQTNGLSGINPQDIASIEVLKDASATAIYGSQGANGVVLITTKQANKDKPQISFNAGVTVSHAMNKLDVLSFDEYVRMLEENPTATTASYLKSIYNGYVDPSNRGTLKVTPVDWQDYCLRTAISRRYYLSVSGRPKGYNYLFSVGYNHNTGIMKTSSADNITMRLNLEKTFSKSLTVGIKGNLGYTVSDLVSGAANGGGVTGATSVLRSMLRTRPFAYNDPFLEDDTLDEEDGELQYGPKRWLSETKNTSERFRVTPSMFLTWKIIPSLSFKSTLGGDFQSQVRTQTKTYKLSPTNGNMAGIGKANNSRFNWDNLLMFNKKIGRHNISGTLGQSMSRTMSATESVSGTHLSQPRAGALSINTSEPQYASMAFGESQSSLMSFFARGIYNYAERYVLTATYRFDGSSRFQGANKWSQFPSFAFAWRPTSEKWFLVPCISNLKIRAGWGRGGNQAVGNYQTRTLYKFSSIGNWQSLSGAQKAVIPDNISNPDLKWETSEQYNLGADISLWKGRLALTVDAYNKDTKDLLQAKNVALSTGHSTIFVNDGSIRNRGLEISLDATPLKAGQWELGLGGNISFNRNTITNVGESGDSGMLYLTPDNKAQVNYWNGSALQNSGYTQALNIFIEGQPMGLFYGFKTDGIIQEGETGPGFKEGETRGPGYIRYLDLDGNGYIDNADRTIIGNPLPRFTYGFNASLSWNNFSLKATFSGAYDFDIFSLNNCSDYLTNEINHNLRKRSWTEAWTPENCSETFPAMFKTNATDDGRYSDHYVEDGSYLRLSNIAVSYSLPINRNKSKIFKRVAFTLSCDNVYVWTDFSGWSPFNNSFGGNVKRMGIDFNSAPMPRNYNFDVKFTF